MSTSPLSLTRAAAQRPPPPERWARQVNDLLRARLLRPRGRSAAVRDDVLSVAHNGSAAGEAGLITFSDAAAEAVVRQGLKAPVLADLAAAAGIEVRRLYEFVGIDRTTVARRAARDDVLPQEAAVKAMQFAELVSVAIDVFGSVADAASWLTREHPLLDGHTPLARARTPWGLRRVQSLLGALKYGGAA